MSEFWSNILQAVLVALVSALAPILVGWAFAKARAAWAEFKQTNQGKAWAIEEAVRLAVEAAEQLGLRGAIEDKREYAFEIAEKYLWNTYGLQVDIDVLYAKIESEVWRQFNRDKELEAKPAGFLLPMTDDEADSHILGKTE